MEIGISLDITSPQAAQSSGGSDVPANALTDANGNYLTDADGNYLIWSA